MILDLFLEHPEWVGAMIAAVFAAGVKTFHGGKRITYIAAVVSLAAAVAALIFNALLICALLVVLAIVEFLIAIYS